MKLFPSKEQCCGCMACIDTCPKNAITAYIDAEGFSYPKVNQTLCVNCGRCKAVCPFGHCEQLYEREPIGYFAAQAKEPARREISTSGAVFPILAEEILGRGGVVYGAGFDDSMRVVHQRVTDQSDVIRLSQSKYVQSDTREIFSTVQEDLRKGMSVLFTGTPCQAEALRRFLGREYERLFLVDLICYGVPSPGVWNKYVHYLEKRHQGTLTEFHFRDKRRRDNGHTVSYQVGGQAYETPYAAEPFTALYGAGCMLRPSCHACPYATVERNSDLTIGDFWGVKEAFPSMEDGMGTSLVIVQSAKGAALWDRVRDSFHCRMCPQDAASQPRLRSPTPLPSKRRLFFALYRALPFSVLMALIRFKKTGRI